MKLIRVLRAVYLEPWLIRPEMHQQIADIVNRHANGEAHAAGLLEMEKQQEVAPEVIDNIAVIPVEGVIGKGVSALEKSSGVTDVGDISAMLDWAGGDDAVEGIVLKIRSPGGTVTGVPELGAKVLALRDHKPIISWTDEMMDSAAYWIGSSANAVYATNSATVGSVGVYMSLMDQSRRAELAGLKPEVFKGGKYKGIGIPGTSLSDEQRAYLQDRVDYLHSEFRAAVRDGRAGVEIDNATMEGQDFFASEAMSVGLIDAVATWEETVRDAKMLAANKKGRR